MEGSHSPFGMIWQIASATGWSVHYILWKVPYPTLLLMMQDAPHWEDGETKPKAGAPNSRPKMKSNTAALFEQHLNNI